MNILTEQDFSDIIEKFINEENYEKCVNYFKENNYHISKNLVLNILENENNIKNLSRHLILNNHVTYYKNMKFKKSIPIGCSNKILINIKLFLLAQRYNIDYQKYDYLVILNIINEINELDNSEQIIKKYRKIKKMLNIFKNNLKKINFFYILNKKKEEITNLKNNLFNNINDIEELINENIYDIHSFNKQNFFKINLRLGLINKKYIDIINIFEEIKENVDKIISENITKYIKKTIYLFFSNTFQNKKITKKKLKNKIYIQINGSTKKKKY